MGSLLVFLLSLYFYLFQNVILLEPHSLYPFQPDIFHLAAHKLKPPLCLFMARIKKKKKKKKLTAKFSHVLMYRSTFNSFNSYTSPL